MLRRAVARFRLGWKVWPWMFAGARAGGGGFLGLHLMQRVYECK
jgi:hypothetical protein